MPQTARMQCMANKMWSGNLGFRHLQMAVSSGAAVSEDSSMTATIRSKSRSFKIGSDEFTSRMKCMRASISCDEMSIADLVGALAVYSATGVMSARRRDFECRPGSRSGPGGPFRFPSWDMNLSPRTIDLLNSKTHVVPRLTHLESVVRWYA